MRLKKRRYLIFSERKQNEIIEDPSNEQAVQEIFNFINDQREIT